MNFLLDTSVVIAVLRKDESIEANLVGHTAYLSSTILGELYFGARKSSRIMENLAKIETFAAEYPILVCDKQTSEHYGILKQTLEMKGRPIPENDIWIAASAIQYGITLVTRDNHFSFVVGLSWITW